MWYDAIYVGSASGKAGREYELHFTTKGSEKLVTS